MESVDKEKLSIVSKITDFMFENQKLTITIAMAVAITINAISFRKAWQNIQKNKKQDQIEKVISPNKTNDTIPNVN